MTTSVNERTGRLLGLRCRACGALRQADERYVCAECFGPIEPAYDLEISSPGLDRELKKDREYAWATGKEVRWPMVLWDEYDDEGLIKVRRCYYDQTVLFSQLGIMPEIPGEPEA